MYDFNRFNLNDMISCSRELRDLGHSSSSMEAVAQQTVRFFYDGFVDSKTGEKSCALVRIFKTHPLEELDEKLRGRAPASSGGAWAAKMQAMVLMATAGEQPDWNDRKKSKNHQVIPLPSPELVERMPMISQLVTQLGFDLPTVVCPQPSLFLDPMEQLHGVFYIHDAKGSPYIPDQEEFVTTYGIKSVLGFGSMLPSGNLFAGIIFSKVAIPRNTEQLFKPLALAVKSAMVPFDGLRVFESEPQKVSIENGGVTTDVRLKSELRAIRDLLNVSDETVIEQANKLEQASRELSQARDKALEASALKSAFVANISHELRTPLSCIVGISDLIMDSELDEEQLELVRGIEESARSLLSLVSDLLDFSKIEAGILNLEIVPFSASELIQEVAKSMADSARAKRLSLITHCDQLLPQPLLGDQSRIRQILINFVTNAIKFTDAGQITIAVTMTGEDDQSMQVRFSVKDTGIGLSATESSRLFLPFSQLEAANVRKSGGTGLGLSICKRLVELMDGRIGVESEPGQGAEFWVDLPLWKPAKEAESTAAQSRTRRWESMIPDNCTVLVVEDNRVLRNLALKQLDGLGLIASGVEKGVEAVDAMKEANFDLILMDCNLPDISGFETTQLIRKQEEETGRHTPIIAMTALAMTGDREKCLDAGMDDYLSKPVSMDLLISKLEYWLLRHAKRKDATRKNG